MNCKGPQMFLKMTSIFTTKLIYKQRRNSLVYNVFDISVHVLNISIDIRFNVKSDLKQKY